MMIPRFRKENKLMIVIVLISLAFIIFGISLLGKENDIEKFVPEPLTLEEVEWVTYVNEDYDFELEHPKHWKVHEDDNSMSPKINIYPFQADLELPLDHFANATHFSIFPRGVPSEGLVGENIEVGLEMNAPVDMVKEYVLADKEKWATMITFEEVPNSWQDWGFIWSGVKIEDLEYSCRRGDEIIDAEVCNPFEGDVLLREGEIDGDKVEIERRIINSFKFTE